MGLKMTHIPRKIKFLKNYKVYSIDIFKNEEKALVRKYLNKSAKEGEIIKISKEKFYKRALRDRNKPAPKITNHPKDKEALRKNELCTYKYPLFKYRFWSNPGGSIPLTNYIAALIDNDSPMNLVYLRELFGDAKVFEVYLNEFYQKGERLPLVEDFLGI